MSLEWFKYYINVLLFISIGLLNIDVYGANADLGLDQSLKLTYTRVLPLASPVLPFRFNYQAA